MANSRLKNILVEEGVLQSKIAVLAGLSAGTVNKATNGKRNPSPTTKAKIVIALNRAVEEVKGTAGTYEVSDIWPAEKKG